MGRLGVVLRSSFAKLGNLGRSGKRGLARALGATVGKFAELKQALASKADTSLGDEAGLVSKAASSKLSAKISDAGDGASSGRRTKLFEDAEKIDGDVEMLIADPVAKTSQNVERNLEADAARDGEIPGPTDNKKVYIACVSLIAALAVSIATGFIVKGYMDRAKSEKQQCLADWETTYIDILKGKDGELLRIDTPQEWSDNSLYLLSVIEAREDVNKDPEKAKKMINDMYDGLKACIGIDTTPLGATLHGIANDVGGAISDIIKPGIDAIVNPAVNAIDSVSNLGMILGILGAVVGAILLIVLGIITARKTKARYKIREYMNNHRYLRSLRLPKLKRS
jgi:hypothetical protein